MNKKHISLGLLFILLAACGGGATIEAPAVPTATAEQQAAAGLSLKRVELATASSDAQDLMIVYSTVELFWPEAGFEEPAEVIVTDDILPALVSGETWVAQGDTSIFWGAMDEGSVDLVMIGIEKDNEVRILGARPGIQSVEDLAPGSKVSGGEIGDQGELVMREILVELGVDPDELDIVAFGGGADARMQALIAGQLDAGIQQPRNIGPLTRAGGVILYEKSAEVPQEIWVVTRETIENNRDAVCAFVLGRIRGKQWAAEGADRRANVDEALEIVKRHGIEPTEDELADWARELEGNQSLDGGATIEGLDKFQQDLRTLGIVSEEFNWRDHADLSCVSEAQQALGLAQRP